MQRSRAQNALIALLLCIHVALTPSLGLAVTQQDYEDALRRAEEAREAAEQEEQRAQDLAEQIREIDVEIARYEAELADLRSQIAEVRANREALEAEIAALEEQIAAKQADIEKTQAELEERTDLLEDRVRESYKQGDSYFLELLFEAKNLADFLARTSYVQMVIASDERIAQELKSEREALREAKAVLERDVETLDVKRQEVFAEEKRLETLELRQEMALSEKQSALDSKAAMLEESQENAERLRKLAEQEEAESQRIAEELAAQASRGDGTYEGELLWPVPGFYRVTSPFGPRICPFHGQEVHTGIDIGSNSGQSIDGQPIVAAGDGIVIKAEYYGGYGNTVMIDHGNGLVTLYAHQRSGGIMVSAGQQVVAGQRIGTVGSTGYSTGPHLHFEVRVNGTPVDPMSYLD
ncbi:MAG: peptidoglycan DD-metalloendopeptidase family protein [Coriobacteriia bacterium]